MFASFVAVVQDILLSLDVLTIFGHPVYGAGTILVLINPNEKSRNKVERILIRVFLLYDCPGQHRPCTSNHSHYLLLSFLCFFFLILSHHPLLSHIICLSILLFSLPFPCLPILSFLSLYPPPGTRMKGVVVQPSTWHPGQGGTLGRRYLGVTD